MVEPETDLTENQQMTGTVVDVKGDPVLGAVVSIVGAKQGNRTWGGQVKHVDRVAITGEDGTFLLTASEDFEQWRLAVSARQKCTHHSQLLETGKHHSITLQVGVHVTGQVVTPDGKPVANHGIGIYPDQMQQFHGRLHTRSREIATDENGRFEFFGVHPEINWNIYSLTEYGEKQGLIETEEFESGKTGLTRSLGDFVVHPVHTIRGTVKMVDGSELPEKSRVFLNRSYAWDSKSLVLKKDGKFEFKVPLNELVSISFLADGCQFSKSKNKFQVGRELEFKACLDQPVKEYEVWLEKK